jgi:Tfp pilus assembly PilM family ATPase
MFFSPATKGYFVESNEHGFLLARTSAPLPPFTVEDIREVAVGDEAGLADALTQLQPKRAPSGYLQASVAIYPSRRLVRRHSLDVKRVKDAGYLQEVCSQQFRIEVDKYAIAVLRSDDGTDYDLQKAVQKEVLFCGMPTEDVHATQDGLLANKIYPERLELGTVAMLGGLVDFLAQSNVKTPTLVLEIGGDTTHSFIVTAGGVEASRPIAQGLDAMVPIVQKELGLKDEEAAKKLFYSNTFDFTGMGPLLTKRLVKELQSSIGFYEVQTGQSVGQLVTTQLAPKLAWLEGSIASSLGVTPFKIDATAWMKARGVTFSDVCARASHEPRWFGLLAIMGRFDSFLALPAEAKK